MAVSVPKRLFKNAVDRNLLKRRIKESYRLNKHGMYDFLMGKDLKIFLLIQYTQKEIKDYGVINSSMLTAFEKLQQEIIKQRH